jgi:hypothetical protein
MFLTGVNINNNGDKLFSGVVDTGDYLCHGFPVIAGFVDTGEQFIAGGNNYRHQR